MPQDPLNRATQMEFSYWQCYAYFLAVMCILMMSNYTALPAQGPTLIIFDSFDVHLLRFPLIPSSGSFFVLASSCNLENVFSIISAYSTSPYHIMLPRYDHCNCVTFNCFKNVNPSINVDSIFTEASLRGSLLLNCLFKPWSTLNGNAFSLFHLS